MKKFFIGVDVSKETVNVSVICKSEDATAIVPLGAEVFANSRMGFRRMLAWSRKTCQRKSFEDMLFCCETTGSYDILMCDYLYAYGVDIWRESALQIKASSGVRKGKNDVADAMVIAEYACRHQDKAQPYASMNETVIQIKALFLYRRKLEQSMTSVKVRANEIKATTQNNPTLRFIYRDQMKIVRDTQKRIKECEKRIKELIDSDADLKRNFDHLLSIRGIGLVNATAMIVFTDNFKRFASSRKLASYYGVATFREKSGTSIDKKASVKSLSNSMLKAYISQAANATILERGIYRPYYERMRAAGKHHLIVMNNIKNKLIQLAFALIKEDCDFEPDHLMREARKRTA